MRWHYLHWVKPSEIVSLRYWIFHIWCEYELWNWHIFADGLRILGFEFERYIADIKYEGQ